MIIMEWIMSACDDMDKVMAATRVRGFLNAIFLSDIVTADGKFIEEHALSEIEEYKRRSCYNFPREHPTKQDWVIWRYLLRGLLLENYELPTPMGKWIASSHRIWEWTTDTEEKELFRQYDDKCVKYAKSQGRVRGLWVKEGESESYFEDKNVSVKK